MPFDDQVDLSTDFDSAEFTEFYGYSLGQQFGWSVYGGIIPGHPYFTLLTSSPGWHDPFSYAGRLHGFQYNDTTGLWSNFSLTGSAVQSVFAEQSCICDTFGNGANIVAEENYGTYGAVIQTKVSADGFTGDTSISTNINGLTTSFIGEDGDELGTHYTDHEGGFDCVGNFNNDAKSRETLVMAAPKADVNGMSNAGKLHIVFGEEWPGSLQRNMSFLNGTNGVTFVGKYQNGNVGSYVATAGNPNNDSYVDFLVAGNGGTGQKKSVLVWGRDKFNNSEYDFYDHTSYGGTQISEDFISSAAFGDVNRDGISDIIWSQKVKGEIYVVFGRTSFPDELKATDVDVKIYDSTGAGKLLGYSVTTADVNNNGYPDIVFTQPGNNAVITFYDSLSWNSEIDIGTEQISKDRAQVIYTADKKQEWLTVANLGNILGPNGRGDAIGMGQPLADDKAGSAGKVTVRRGYQEPFTTTTTTTTSTTAAPTTTTTTPAPTTTTTSTSTTTNQPTTTAVQTTTAQGTTTTDAPTQGPTTTTPTSAPTQGSTTTLPTSAPTQGTTTTLPTSAPTQGPTTTLPTSAPTPGTTTNSPTSTPAPGTTTNSPTSAPAPGTSTTPPASASTTISTSTRLNKIRVFNTFRGTVYADCKEEDSYNLLDNVYFDDFPAVANDVNIDLWIRNQFGENVAVAELGSINNATGYFDYKLPRYKTDTQLNNTVTIWNNAGDRGRYFFLMDAEACNNQVSPYNETLFRSLIGLAFFAAPRIFVAIVENPGRKKLKPDPNAEGLEKYVQEVAYNAFKKRQIYGIPWYIYITDSQRDNDRKAIRLIVNKAVQTDQVNFNIDEQADRLSLEENIFDAIEEEIPRFKFFGCISVSWLSKKYLHIRLTNGNQLMKRNHLKNITRKATNAYKNTHSADSTLISTILEEFYKYKIFRKHVFKKSETLEAERKAVETLVAALKTDSVAPYNTTGTDHHLIVNFIVEDIQFRYKRSFISRYCCSCFALTDAAAISGKATSESIAGNAITKRLSWFRQTAVRSTTIEMKALPAAAKHQSDGDDDQDDVQPQAPDQPYVQMAPNLPPPHQANDQNGHPNGVSQEGVDSSKRRGAIVHEVAEVELQPGSPVHRDTLQLPLDVDDPFLQGVAGKTPVVNGHSPAGQPDALAHSAIKQANFLKSQPFVPGYNGKGKRIVSFGNQGGKRLNVSDADPQKILRAPSGSGKYPISNHKPARPGS